MAPPFSPDDVERMTQLMSQFIFWSSSKTKESVELILERMKPFGRHPLQAPSLVPLVGYGHLADKHEKAIKVTEMELLVDNLSAQIKAVEKIRDMLLASEGNR
jgi:hypothetical protein